MQEGTQGDVDLLWESVTTFCSMRGIVGMPANLLRSYALLLSIAAFIGPAAAQMRGHGGPVRAVAISADASFAVSGSFDTSAIRWSLARNSAEQVLRFHDGPVNAVAVLKDGRVVTAGEEGRIAVWQRGEQAPGTV